MNALVRFLLALAVATWLAIPGVSSDGGDNAGGTGVWILPRPTFLTSASASTVFGTQCRDSRNIAATLPGFSLTTSAELGATFTATMLDPISGEPIALPTSGRDVVLTEEVLRILRDVGGVTQIVVADSAMQGYVMAVSFDSSGGGTIKVY